MFNHIDSTTFGEWLWQFRGYGQQGVVIFFVMSGFVIAYTAGTKNANLRHYSIARAARLYSVVVPALILTLLVDSINSLWFLNPDHSTFDGGANNPVNLGSILQNLTFTSQLWFSNRQLWDNVPLWSLGYEVWYYIIFAAATYFHGYVRNFLVLIIAALMGPRILVLFPVWLLGVAAYQITRRSTLAPRYAWPLFIGTGMAASYFLVNNTDQALDSRGDASVHRAQSDISTVTTKF